MAASEIIHFPSAVQLGLSFEGPPLTHSTPARCISRTLPLVSLVQIVRSTRLRPCHLIFELDRALDRLITSLQQVQVVRFMVSRGYDVTAPSFPLRQCACLLAASRLALQTREAKA